MAMASAFLKRIRACVLVAAGLYAALAVAAADSRDGTVDNSRPCDIPAVPYAQYLKNYRESWIEEQADAVKEGFVMPPLEQLMAAALTERAYDAVWRAGHRCQRLTYWSDGLRVVGFVVKPRQVNGKAPVVIWNRGGNRELSKNEAPRLLRLMHPFLDAGFIVLASQYRGNDGGEGREEFGGRDVNDVLNLVNLARRMDDADPDNVFLLGGSRGGMMTLLALRDQAAVNAAAVWSPALDLTSAGAQRPALVERVYRQLIPDFTSRGDEALRERSPMAWPEKLSRPLLIVQGTNDWRVPAGDVLQYAQRLQALRKPYELIMYDGDLHGMPLNAEDRNQRTIAWFRRHLRNAR